MFAFHKNVSKSYAKGKVKAVDHISLEVRRERYLDSWAQWRRKNNHHQDDYRGASIGLGTITVNRYDIEKDPINAKMSMGYVPDTHDIYDRLTGIEYLNFIADVYGVSHGERKQSIEKYLDMFDMKQAAGQPIKSYSHGMKQKIIVTGALLHNPPLWILDEPMTGLDPKSAHLLKEEMNRHCQKGNTVFFSTHILEVAERLCHRIGIINKGKIIAVGTLDELRSSGDKSLESIFLELTDEGSEIHE